MAKEDSGNSYLCEDHRVKLEVAIKVWAETVKKSNLKPSSYDRLESTIECQIVPRIGWYHLDELTDTNATRLFEKRVDIKIISELLGHSSTEITYKIYVHVIDSLKESAVEAIDLD